MQLTFVSSQVKQSSFPMHLLFSEIWETEGWCPTIFLTAFYWKLVKSKSLLLISIYVDLCLDEFVVLQFYLIGIGQAIWVTIFRGSCQWKREKCRWLWCCHRHELCVALSLRWSISRWNLKTGITRISPWRLLSPFKGQHFQWAWTSWPAPISRMGKSSTSP